MENDICPVCGRKLNVETVSFSVRYSCHGCRRYERIEPNHNQTRNRVLPARFEPDKSQ